MKLGLVELPAYLQGESFESKLTRVHEAVETAPVDILVWPELCHMPYTPVAREWDPRHHALPVRNTFSACIEEFARRTETQVFFPFLEAGADGFFNSIAHIQPSDATRVVYRKVHLPDGKYANESAKLVPGKMFDPIHTENALIGLGICYDRYFPEHFRYLAATGATLLICPSAASGSGEKTWRDIGKSHAVFNRSFFALSNRVGIEGTPDRRFFGDCFIVDPWGNFVEPLQYDSVSGLKVFELDLSQIAEARRAWPFLEQWRMKWQLQPIHHD